MARAKGKHENPPKKAAPKAKSAQKAKPVKKAEPAQKAETRTKRNTKRNSGGSKKNILIAAVLILVLIVAAGFVGGVVVGKTAAIHPNMVLNGISVGGMTVDEAEAALDAGGWEAQEGSKVSVTLPGEYEFEVTSAEAGLDMNCREAAEAAYRFGHSGNPVSDLFAYFKCIGGKVTTGDILSAANEDGIKAKLDGVLAKYNDFLDKGYMLDTENECMKMVKGSENISIDSDELCTKIIDVFTNGGSSLEYTVSITSADKPDFDKIHDEVFSEAVSAEYDRETGKASKSSTGIDFDVDKAEKLWADAEPGDLVAIPLDVVNPKYTTEQLDSMLFADKLGSQTTDYSSSASGRATNVELAASKINGVILNPGEVFSYNDVVGQRTAAAGFKSAAAYAGGKVVQEIGGGICQVSSTLYCAALYANLEITARDCHHFAVGYLPAGLDATVSWGGPEFKFKNSRDLPIKVVAKCSGGKLTVEIWGSDIDGSYVEMSYSSSKGTNGTSATTYRLVYDKDGKLISRTHEADSFYHFHTADPTPTPAPSANPTPTPSPSTAPTPDPTPEPETPPEETTEN